MSTTIATYLPESMLIRIGPDLRILDESGAPIPFPTAEAFAWFFHEYVHYLHNISTASGIAAFVNTLELWRCFRPTIDEGGNSLGSAPLEAERNRHLQELTAYLDGARRKNVPLIKRLVDVASVKVLSMSKSSGIVTKQGTLLSVVVCEAEAMDRGGQTEALTVKIGTLELLEGAAWLLEKKMAVAIDPCANVVPPAVFPYRIAEAVVDYIMPGVDDEGVLAFILAALQSSDAPGGFAELLSAAQHVELDPDDAPAYLRAQAECAIAQNKAGLEAQLSALEAEFANEGAMAKAVLHVISIARQSFAERERDPFFELEMIAAFRDETQNPVQVLSQLLPCAVLQQNPGPADQVQRDFLLSFYPATDIADEDIESLMRVVQAIFHYVGVHRSVSGFVETQRATHRPCPFYCCCNLALRREDPAVCGQSPWQAADWQTWDENKGMCWYGAAVRITRPPPV
ncbi:hypothetical protein ACJ5NV_07750 [Loktanella agnita]|uniref:hypothetical protein n=1 Tax=Loktanella agnita TaxID=287097 RepID=UPI0039871A1D